MDETRILIAARNIAFQDTVRAVGLAFEERGGALALLKGSSLLFSLYRDRPQERGMADVDVLVRPAQLPLLDRVLRAQGFRIADCGDLSYEREHPLRVTFDIHTSLWHLDDAGHEALWSRMRRPPVEDFPARLLDPADEVLYLLHHGLVHRGETRGWTVSEACARIVHEGESWSWAVFTARVREAGAELPIRRALAEASAQGWLSPPASALEELDVRPGLAGWIFLKLLDAGPVVDIGHVHRLLLAPGRSSRWRLAAERLFPDRSFLRRRYKVREGEAVFRLLRFMHWGFKGARLARAVATGWWRNCVNRPSWVSARPAPPRAPAAPPGHALPSARS